MFDTCDKIECFGHSAVMTIMFRRNVVSYIFPFSFRYIKATLFIYFCSKSQMFIRVKCHILGGGPSLLLTELGYARSAYSPWPLNQISAFVATRNLYKTRSLSRTFYQFENSNNIFAKKKKRIFSLRYRTKERTEANESMMDKVKSIVRNLDSSTTIPAATEDGITRGTFFFSDAFRIKYAYTTEEQDPKIKELMDVVDQSQGSLENKRDN